MPVPPGRVHRDFQWQFCQVDANPEPHAPQYAATADDFGTHRSGCKRGIGEDLARAVEVLSIDEAYFDLRFRFVALQLEIVAKSGIAFKLSASN